jgi:hypothetical protein
MSNNVFSWMRLRMLFKQHLIHNAQFLLLSTGAYIGLIFIVLSVTQVGNSLQPHDLGVFQAFLIGFVVVFGVLYVGHSFPAFRSKESTISYLMTPASALEKFVFEVISRIGLVLVTLPVLYWLTFHLQGFFFTIFTDKIFQPIGLKYIVTIDANVPMMIYSLVSAAIVFCLSLAFTGAAMFTKQPLVKSLFATATVVMLFVGYSYIVLEPIGLGKYNPPDRMILVPLNENQGLLAVTAALFAATMVMLFVAYRKLKEREV